jgi:3',5'-cyclic AMP phosphodiesterase CpdA
VTRIHHLSDLHLFASPDEQPAIVEGLVDAMARDHRQHGKVDLLAITGDVFDSGTLDPDKAVAAFGRLLGRMHEALGGAVPTLIVPGNHDRRQYGLVGPDRAELFDALKDRLGDRAWVGGCDWPFLADVVPPEVHGLPLWVVAYDSTYLEQGLLSAGGMIRPEDLIRAASRIGDRHPDWPVLVLVHHHLVPTPLTDMEEIDSHGSHPLVEWGLREVLPRLVSHADKEELTMTALGAGTALSTLHTMGRAVLVLHGHKHYATARLLDGTWQGHGDVLIASAGSAGTAQAWTASPDRDAARLWPSFNVLQLQGGELDVQTVSFGWKGNSTGSMAYRPLVRAARDGSRWHQRPIARNEIEMSSDERLELNESVVELEPSQQFGMRRWDYVCTRRVQSRAGAAPSRYVETVDGMDKGQLMPLQPSRRPTRELPASLALELDGESRYHVQGGVGRTLAERSPGSSPFGWVGLMNRYASERARLELRGLGERAGAAFASATDLGTGLERAISLEREGDRLVLEYAHCPARHMLRIHWPLERD